MTCSWINLVPTRPAHRVSHCVPQPCVLSCAMLVLRPRRQSDGRFLRGLASQGGGIHSDGTVQKGGSVEPQVGAYRV